MMLRRPAFLVSPLRPAAFSFAILLGVQFPVAPSPFSVLLPDSRVEGVEFALPRKATDAAFPRLGVFHQVATVERVPAFAVGQTSVVSWWAVSTQNIDLVRDGLQVPGIHASPVSAQVVKDQAFGNWPYEQFVGAAVRLKPNDPAVHQAGRLSVSAGIGSTLPLPAFVGPVGVHGEAFFERHGPQSHTRKLTEPPLFLQGDACL